jgi:protoporphyrinogen oxidase
MLNGDESSRTPAAEARTVIIGGGPAGLTAAYELSKAGRRSVVLEADSNVGGISRTAQYKGYKFDIGGHRFYTKVSIVERMWHEVLHDDLLKRSRSSRILFNKRFFKYPLDAWNVFTQLGPIESFLCLLSYIKAALEKHIRRILRIQKPELDFETYVCTRFGRRLFQRFFESYTEKVWGIPCNKIRAEWAAQRIKGISVKNVILSFLRFGNTGKKNAIKSFIDAFEYPRLGPGMLWERVRDIVDQQHSKVHLNTKVTRILWEPGKGVTAVEAGGQMHRGDSFISSMPIRDLIAALDPPPPPEVLAAKDMFSYRDFLTVALITRGQPQTVDNWLYIHEPSVKVGRVQIFNNWSPEMVPEPDRTCYGLEYFCFEGDGLWTMEDSGLVALATKELAQIGIVKEEDIVDGAVVRQPKAYPVYDEHFRTGLDILRAFLTQLPNLQLVGRNGMHKYNNQDHSMLTAMLAVRNILGANYDLWRVNIDTEYQEEGGNITEDELRDLEHTQPLVPERITA